eukprot:2746652-Prymnesium_polylepis.1
MQKRRQHAASLVLPGETAHDAQVKRISCASCLALCGTGTWLVEAIPEIWHIGAVVSLRERSLD